MATDPPLPDGFRQKRTNLDTGPEPPAWARMQPLRLALLIPGGGWERVGQTGRNHGRFHELLLVVRGTWTLTVAGQSQTLGPGWFRYRPPGSRDRSRTAGVPDLERFSLHWREDTPLLPDPRPAVGLDPQARGLALISQAWGLWRRDRRVDPTDRRLCDLLLEAAVLTLLHQEHHDQADPIARTAAWIRDHAPHPITIAAMAAVAGLGPDQFIRRFRTVHGLTPWQFLLRERLARARALLRDPALTRIEAARRSGLGSDRNLRRWLARIPAP